MSGYRTLVPNQDLRHFDDTAIRVVTDYQSYGWVGKVSRRGHAILRAPDGQATTAVAPKGKNSYGGDVAREDLKKWLRAKQRHATPRSDSSFGLTGASESPDPWEPPWVTARYQSGEARLRMRKILAPWWKDAVKADTPPEAILLETETDDDWVVFCKDGESKMIRLVGAGPGTDPAEIEKMKSRLKNFNGEQESTPMTEPGPPTEKKKFPCPEPGCDASYDHRGALNLHSAKHDTQTYPCPLCDRVLPTPAARARHVHSSFHVGDARLPAALEQLGLSPKARPKLLGTVPRTKAGRVIPQGTRKCEYCELTLPITSIGGHHRAHKASGHIKIADGGDGATQTTKAITTPNTPPEAGEALTQAPAKPEVVMVGQARTGAETFTVNGTGHDVAPADLLDQVRMLVNPQMVGEVERLRSRCTTLGQELERVTREKDELQARMDIMKEALNV